LIGLLLASTSGKWCVDELKTATDD